MKRTHKISVTRQTLRSLSADETTEVAGGGFTENVQCGGDTVKSHGPSCGNATICRSWRTECP